MRVLVTRPEEEGRATAARLAALGHEALAEPVTRIVAAEGVVLPADGFQAVTATSLNAVEVLAGRPDLAPLLTLPFLAVGDRTAAAARAVGFTDVRSAEGDRRALARLAAATLDPREGPLLWLVGRDRAGDLVADLAPTGLEVRPIEVYRAEKIPGLRRETEAALRQGAVDAALVFSPRSATIFLEKLAERGFSPASLDFPVHAISEATARPLSAAGWRTVVVANTPDTDAMLADLAPPSPADPLGHAVRSSIMSPKPTKTTPSSEAAPDPAAPIDPAVVAEAEKTSDDHSVETAHDHAETSHDPAEPASEPVEPATAASEPEPVVLEPVDPEPAAPVEPTATPAAATIEAEPPKPAPAAKGVGLGGLVAATLVGGILGVGGSWGLADRGLMPGGDRMGALEAKLADLQAKKPAPAVDADTQARLAALDKRLADLAARPAPTTPAVDLAPLEARIAKLEAAPPAPAADLAALEARLAKLEATPSVPADLTERLAGLEAAAKARTEAARSAVAGAVAALPSGEAATKAFADVAGKLDQAIGATREAADQQIAALKARLDALGEGGGKALLDRLSAISADVKKQSDDLSAALSTKLDAASAATAAELARRADEASKALDGLRRRLETLEAMRGDVDAALGRLGAVEQAQKSAGAAEAGLTDAIDNARVAAEARIATLEKRLAGLEGGAEAARKAQGDAVVAVALADLKSAVDAGRPFKAEFEVVKAASKGGLDLAALEPYAAAGVPSVAQLRDRWPAQVRILLDLEEKKTAGDGVFDRFWSHATSVVKVRPTGETKGDGLSALLARVEAPLAKGDLTATLAAWKALPDDARTTTTAWGGALAARVEVDAALARQTAAAVSKLGQ